MGFINFGENPLELRLANRNLWLERMGFFDMANQIGKPKCEVWLKITLTILMANMQLSHDFVPLLGSKSGVGLYIVRNAGSPLVKVLKYVSLLLYWPKQRSHIQPSLALFLTKLFRCAGWHLLEF